MDLFRKLAGNVFFKIILAFVAITFVLFGVSDFILGSSGSWVVKVGGTTVSANKFNKALQSDRETIMSQSQSDEAMKYVESEQFKSDVLGRIVNRLMIEKLHNEYDVQASKKLILEAVAKDPSFKNAEGKFDRELFKKFLAKHGLNETKYIDEIANDVTATMIIQTMSLAAPMNDVIVFETESFKQEKRIADVFTISMKNVGNVAKPTDDEVKEYYEANQKAYSVPEMRKVSYMHFSPKDFSKDMKVSDEELRAEYEKNKDQYAKPETRDFLHVLFDEEGKAKEFLDKLEATKGEKADFIKLAKDQVKKEHKELTLTKISKKDLIPELSDPIFKLEVNKHSEVLKSPLGFHIFLLTDIKKSQPMEFAEVKESLRKNALEGRETKIVQEKISAIDDALLTAKSLSEVAKKFGLRVTELPTAMNQNGQDAHGNMVKEVKGFEGFIENSFALKKDQPSKIFYAKNSEGFYAVMVDEIIPAHQTELAQIKSQVAEDLNKSRKNEALKKLAKKIGDELAANPSSASQIAAKYQLKTDKNREFPRIYYINFQGRQVPFQNAFLEELFKLKVGQATSVTAGGTQEFVIGVLREIKKVSTNPAQFEEAKKSARESFKTEVLQEFNKFLLEKNPVKVNEKLMGKKEQQ